MQKFSKIFTEKDIFNLCYSVHLTGVIDNNIFPSNDLEEKYYNLPIKDRECLNKIIDKILKSHKKAFDYLETLENDPETLKLAQKNLLRKIHLDFRILCNCKY